MPEVTVLIPAYNAARFVEEAIRSALAQTHRDLEVLVVDDGSQDETCEKVATFGRSVRLLRVRHGGLAWARNQGMQAAKGEFITFLDADDILEDQLVSRAVDFLRRDSRLAFVFCNVRLFYTNGLLTAPRIPSRAFGGAEELVLRDPLEQILSAGYWISSSGLCARRTALQEAGAFDESLWGAEDFEYWSRLYVHRPIGFIVQPLARIRRHGDNMTAQPFRMAPCIALSVRKVSEHYVAAGRPAAVRAVRDYGSRSLRTCVRGLLGRGDRRGAWEVLWKYRDLLMGFHWPLLAAACLIPSRVLRAGRRLRERLHAAAGAAGMAH
ncbi:MAG: glycosyltransferase family 2 protein [Chloroflexi bacterium]|nr:glycosyltransferase family 2 protein [Chloroflexota bacterium]